MAERLTNSCKEIPTLCDNAEYWLQVYFKLKDYEDLGETGRLVILPEDMDLKKLIKCTDGDGLCPRDVGLTDRCELSCLECWLAALKGEEHDNL